MASIKEIHFSEARQRLSEIVDQVEGSGKPVTILRHGKPSVVIVSHGQYAPRSGQKPKWKLAGSLKFREDVDVDRAIAEGRKAFSEVLEVRQKRLRKP